MIADVVIEGGPANVIDEFAPTLEEIRREYRREGMADAVVRLVLSRRFPHVDANQWCQILGLNQQDLKAAIARLREGGSTTEVPTPAQKPEVAHRRYRGGFTKEQRQKYTHPCPFCETPVLHGRPWLNHMARFHPGQWEAKLEAELEEKYGATCPDCGERIGVKVTVTVERHECCAHGALS